MEQKVNKLYVFLAQLLNFWDKLIEIVTSKKFIVGFVVVLMLISFTFGFLFKYKEIKLEMAWQDYLIKSKIEFKQKMNDDGVRFIMKKYEADSLSTYEAIMESETPILLAAVVAKESEFNRMAVSHCKALGLGQVMFFHFRKDEDWTDPRTNLRKADYILQQCLKDCNNNEILALASYNAGIGRVIKAGWKVPDTKNNETKNYVQRVTNLVSETMNTVGQIY